MLDVPYLSRLLCMGPESGVHETPLCPLIAFHVLTDSSPWGGSDVLWEKQAWPGGMLSSPLEPLSLGSARGLVIPLCWACDEQGMRGTLWGA